MKATFTRIRKRWLAVSLLAIAAAVAVAAWRKPTAADYRTVAVKYADIEDKVVSSGILQPVKKVEVGAQVSGQLKTLHVQLGQSVKQGTLLASIDPSIARNDLLNAEATLEQQAAQNESRQSELEQAERDLARQTAMLQGDAASRLDVEQAATKVRTMTADLRALAAQIRQTRIAVESARTRLGYTQLTAPIDGEVVNIATQEGQTIIAAQQAPVIMTLANLDAMIVKAQVSEADVARLSPGQKVYFTTLGNAEERHFGTLRTIQPTPDKSGTEKAGNAVFYSALFDVPNPKRDLWSDMTVTVNFVLNEAKHVLVVPVLALGEKGKDGRYAVQVLNQDGSVSQRMVTISFNDHVNARVAEGLAEGERVITGGNDTLPAGEK